VDDAREDEEGYASGERDGVKHSAKTSPAILRHQHQCHDDARDRAVELLAGRGPGRGGISCVLVWLLLFFRCDVLP
jgi:hypothetical protein